MSIRKIIGTTLVGIGTIIAFAPIAFMWLTQPLEVFSQSDGRCLYQLEATNFGFGPGREVPCGTYGSLAVERVSEIFFRERV